MQRTSRRLVVGLMVLVVAAGAVVGGLVVTSGGVVNLAPETFVQG